MVFPDIKIDSVYQECEKITINGSGTWVSHNNLSAIETVEIDPGDGVFRNIYTKNPDHDCDCKNFKLCWQFDTAGSYTANIRVSFDDGFGNITSNTKSATFEVVTAVDDCLFSSDQDLIAWEENILCLLPEGRSSFNFKHREAQRYIIDHMHQTVKDKSQCNCHYSSYVYGQDHNYQNTHRYSYGYLQALYDYHRDGCNMKKREYFKKEFFCEKQEVRLWSVFMTLSMIYEGLSNSVDDLYSIKAVKYEKMACEKQRQAYQLDIDEDGNLDQVTDGFITTVDLF